jgi:hypothetical protein
MCVEPWPPPRSWSCGPPWRSPRRVAGESAWRLLGKAITEDARADAADEADFPVQALEDALDVSGRTAQRLRQIRDRVRSLTDQPEELLLVGGWLGGSSFMFRRLCLPQPPMGGNGMSEWI